jgi:hypothetical protein
VLQTAEELGRREDVDIVPLKIAVVRPQRQAKRACERQGMGIVRIAAGEISGSRIEPVRVTFGLMDLL